MIDLVYLADAAWAGPAAVSAASARMLAKRPEEIRLHVIAPDAAAFRHAWAAAHEGQPPPCDVREWRPAAEPTPTHGGAAGAPWHGTRLVWARLAFDEIFPELDWIVSCDADTLWLDDPAALWALRDERLLIQASADPPAAGGGPMPHHAWWAANGLELPPERCYCCGLMLMNLARMRATTPSFASVCRDFLATHPDPPMREQTVLCWAARAASAPLPAEWGVFSFWHVSVPHPRLIHYVEDLPWRRRKINRLMSDAVMLWWDFAESAGIRLPEAGHRGCRSRFDYLWRRAIFLALRPFAGVIDAIPSLKPHLRNARGLDRETFRPKGVPS